MSTPTLPGRSVPYGPAQPRPSRPWTAAAYLALMAYALWLPTMVGVVYVVTGWFDVAPYQGVTVAGVSGIGWLTTLVVSVLAGLPGWIGTRFAVHAVRVGGRGAASVALVLCLGSALAFLAFGQFHPL